MKDRSADFVQGKVSKLLFNRTMPMVIAMVGMLSFNLIDTYFVGKISTTALAAISFTFPITYIITAFAIGLGTGASAVVSRAIGSKEGDKAVRLASDALTLGLAFAVIFVITGMLTVEPLFTMLGARDDTLQLIKDYMYIWYPGSLFVVIPMIGNSIFRAKGDTKTPSAIMMIAVIVNTALDPILIFGWGAIPAFGIKGAATATVISRAITFLAAFYFLYKRDALISFKTPTLEAVKQSYRSILYIGLPSAGTSLIVPVGASLILSLVSAYGTEAVAGFGVATRIEAFSLTVIMALGSVLGPFIGQNFGAEKLDRVNKGVNISSGFGMVWGLVALLFLSVLAEPLAKIFNDNPAVVEVVKTYLWILPLSYGFQSVVMLTGVSFNVLNKPFYSATLGLLRMIALYLPLAYAGSQMFGLNGIFIAGAGSNFIVGILGYFWLKNHIFKLSDIKQPV